MQKVNPEKTEKTYHKKSITVSACQIIIFAQVCVVQDRMFVNKILALFRCSYNSRTILPDTEFFKDIDWFLTFLPVFNGHMFYDKKTRLEVNEIFIEACLMGAGSIWQNRVYALPIIHIPYFELTMVHFEIINLEIALRLWGSSGKNSALNVHCDNRWWTVMGSGMFVSETYYLLLYAGILTWIL